ncbi:MAG: hypothetical protein CTY25_06590 [Methylobacterium sp.]|nr:MAG: hypothetical protein CTY25_06590 [Methylobacterium sp.]
MAAVPPFIDWKPWRERIAALAAPTLGLPIRFGGELRLSLLPTPEIDADQVSIGPEDRPLLTAGRLTLSLDLTALARGILRITEARGDQVSVRAEAIDLLPKPGERPTAPGRKLGLDRLTLKSVTLIRKDADDALAPPLDIVLEAPDFAGPFRFEVTIPREGREWRGQIGRFEDGRARLRATAEDHPRAIRAMADGWFGQPGHPSQPAFDGQVQVSGNPVFGRGSETVQMPFDLQARVLLQAGQLVADPVTLNIGGERGLSTTGKGFLDLMQPRPALRLELAARRFDLARALARDPEREPRPRDGLAEANTVIDWLNETLRESLPIDLALDLAVSQVQLAHGAAQDVRLQAGFRGDALALDRFEARLAGRNTFAFERKADAADPVDGVLNLSFADLPAFARAFGLAAPEGLPAEASLRMALRRAGGRLEASDLVVESAAGQLRGRMSLAPAPPGRSLPPVLAFALDADRFDARLVGLGDPLGSPALWLGIDGRLDIREVVYDGRGIGSIRLAFTREGPRTRFDELTLRGRAGEEIRISGQIAEGEMVATAKIDAEKLEDLSRMAEAIAPGPWSAALRARASLFEPALALARIRIDQKNGETIWTIEGEGRLGGSVIAVTSQSEVRGQDLHLSLTGEVSQADSARLVRQIAGVVPAAGTRLPVQPGKLGVTLEGNPRRLLSLKMQGDLLGTQISADGSVSLFRAQPFDGLFTLRAVDLAPLYRALGGGAPALPDGTPARVQGRFFAEPTKLTLTAFSGEIGPNAVQGEISFDVARGGQVAGQLRLGDLQLPSLLAPVMPQSGLVPLQGPASTRGFPPPLAPFRPGDLWIEARSLTLAEGLRLAEPKFVLRFAPGLVAIEGLDARTGDARLGGQVTLMREGEAVNMAGRLAFARLPLPGAGARAEGEIPFTSQGRSLQDLLVNLGGAGRIEIEAVTLPLADPTALPRLFQRPMTELTPIDENRLGGLLDAELQKGAVRLPPFSLPITLAGGVLRLSGPPVNMGSVTLQPGFVLDLPRLSYDLRLAQRLNAAPKGWLGALPEIALSWSGRAGWPPGDARRTLVVSALLNGLLAVGLQRDLETIETFEADQRERSFFLRRVRAEAETERRRQEAEKRRQEVEAERRRQEAEAERRRQEAEAERRRQEAEAERRRQEAETERRRQEAEAERRRQEVEAERRRASETPAPGNAPLNLVPQPIP